MKSYTIHLIRHGMCQGNEEGRYIGSTDSPLSDRGREALLRLAGENEYPKAQVFYSSPLLRCTQTMEILYPHRTPQLVEDFRETDFGQWEGKKAEDLMKHDIRYQEWIKGEQNTFPPEGESGAVFMHRVCRSFETLVTDMMKKGNTSAVIVTHGGVMMTILTAYGLPRAKFYDWMTDFGCGYSLRITPGLWMRSMVAEVYARLPIREEDTMEQARQAADLLWGEKK